MRERLSMSTRSVLRPHLAYVVVCALLLCLGALPFFLYPRAGDLISDATYYELARSLADEGWYGFNSRTETMLPPGFPAVIALLRFYFGDSYAVFIRSMA